MTMETQPPRYILQSIYVVFIVGKFPSCISETCCPSLQLAYAVNLVNRVEIANHEPTILVEDVLGLDIGMNHFKRVHVVQTSSDICDNFFDIYRLDMPDHIEEVRAIFLKHKACNGFISKLAKSVFIARLNTEISNVLMRIARQYFSGMYFALCDVSYHSRSDELFETGEYQQMKATSLHA